MSNITKKRLFIALNLPLDGIKAINDFIINIKPKTSDIRWISSRGLHITLHFLGEISIEKEKKVITSLQSLDNQFKEIEFETGRIGAFPSKDNPKVVYLECKQINGNSIEKLQKLIGINLIKTGIKIDERRWRPHITIGRVRKKINLNTGFEFKKFNFKIESFEIME